MEERPDATPEMIGFFADLQIENNEKATEKARTEKRYKKKLREISDAIVGLGGALNTLNEEKVVLEEEMEEFLKKPAYTDIYARFTSKFGVNPSNLNMNPKLNQKEVDKLASKED